ncbi:MAG: alkaline phosphatase family protein [Tannerella sp.]|jgi:hypothetical protein|nr:alkaline phosphatase family protein [Tannerella sp.]
MKKILAIIGIATITMLTGCRQSEFPKGIEHVVIIGLDGLSVWGLQASNTPCLDSLMQNGAYSLNVRSILPTVSTPNWTAMMTGTGPEATGAVDNSWVNGALPYPHAVIDKDRGVPTIFRLIREQMPDAVMACVHNWDDFPNMYDVKQLDLDEDYTEDAEVARRSVEYIKEKKPNFMFCYFTDPDHTMHIRGHLSPDYLDIVETLDGYVRQIVDAVNDAGIADKTVFMIMSDHGGIFYAHGGHTFEELNTPFIFNGKGVKKNYRIKQQMYRYDLAANIAFALGLEIPQYWTGRPTQPAFEGFDEPKNLRHQAEVLPSPAFITKEINETFLYGGYWVDESPTVRIDSRPDMQDAQVRYTTDLQEPTSASSLYEKPFKLDKPTIVMAKTFGENGESVSVRGEYRIADTKAGNGLNYALYHCPDAKSMPTSFANLTPVAMGICYEFGFHTPENGDKTGLNDALGRYSDHIAAVFSGWIEIDEDDAYTFSLWSTGGSKLYIGNELIVNNRSNGHTGNSGDIELTKGRHPIRVECFHNDQAKGTILNAHYESRRMSKQMIPAQKLFRNR